jgi:hypothetical protein
MDINNFALVKATIIGIGLAIVCAVVFWLLAEKLSKILMGSDKNETPKIEGEIKKTS